MTDPTPSSSSSAPTAVPAALALPPLSPALLYTRCGPASLGVADSSQLPPDPHPLGQERAVSATLFAAAIGRHGYNLFVMGEPGSGRHAIVQRLIAARALELPVPDDWVYVHNFADGEQPLALRLPAGRGQSLRRAMQGFVEDLEPAIAAAFDADDFRTRLEAIQNECKAREEEALRQVAENASHDGLLLLRTGQGFVFAPAVDGKPMAPEAYAQLPEAEKNQFHGLIQQHGEGLEKLFRQFPRWRRDMQARIKELGRETMTLAVGHLVDELKEPFPDLPEVQNHLDQILADVIAVGGGLRGGGEEEGETPTGTVRIAPQRYQVNLLVDHAGRSSAPVVQEDHPTFTNLVGRVDHVSHMGTQVTNFTLIRAGALHRANGGFLLMDAAKLLSQPYAWEVLKRCLKLGLIRIESLGQSLGMMGGPTLEPVPIPLGCKLVLVGEPEHYYLLRELDPEFEELFKVVADFDTDVARTPENSLRFAQLVADLARRRDLLPLSADALARFVEYGARLAEDAERLSLRSRPVADLLTEADYLARTEGQDVIAPAHVAAALAAREHRSDRLRERYQREILRDTLLVASSGDHVGQINALAVIDLGDVRFAHPVRITATVHMGDGDVIDIERETELGGSIHSKGVMILSSFLASRYSREMPLSLSAALVFEQSYGPVEGDSASLAELCALMSALAGVPIRQSLAITGSVNQFGRVQAIGGANEKIEGFFDICVARGLTGEQGVIIPDANAKHLMLKEDVVQAAAEGKFRIWAVSDVDQAMELLTGLAAGVPDEQGQVAEGTLNYYVAAELAALALARQNFGAEVKKAKESGAAIEGTEAGG